MNSRLVDVLHVLETNPHELEHDVRTTAEGMRRYHALLVPLNPVAAAALLGMAMPIALAWARGGYGLTARDAFELLATDSPQLDALDLCVQAEQLRAYAAALVHGMPIGHMQVGG